MIHLAIFLPSSGTYVFDEDKCGGICTRSLKNYLVEVQ